MDAIKKNKIAFFGTPEFVVPVLAKLLKHKYNVELVVTRPAKPQGRRLELKPSPVEIFARKNKLKTLAPQKLDEQFIASFRSADISLAIVAAYGKIIPTTILDLPKLGFFNIHPSLLPRYRGAAPLAATILNGDEKTGVCLMKMDEGMDSGPLVECVELPLTGHEYIEDLQLVSFATGAKLLLKNLPIIINNQVKLTKQNHSHATFTKLITKADGLIDWAKPVEVIERQIRAYHHWPTSYTFWQGEKIIISQASIFSLNEKTEVLGRIILKDDFILVATGCGYLRLQTVKMAGKKEIAINDFVHGQKKFIGSNFD